MAMFENVVVVDLGRNRKARKDVLRLLLRIEGPRGLGFAVPLCYRV